MTALQPGGVRVLIVDDEAPARQRISDLLNQDKDVSSLQEAGYGETAVQMILSEKPSMVLLDVQMPELNGLEVIEAVGPENMSLTVFVSAYDQHAIRAFEVNALDYLLKPFSDERFEMMLTRVKRRRDDFHLREFRQNVARVIATQATETRYLDRLAETTFWSAQRLLYQLRSDETGTRGAMDGTREEAYSGAGGESAATG